VGRSVGKQAHKSFVKCLDNFCEAPVIHPRASRKFTSRTSDDNDGESESGSLGSTEAKQDRHAAMEAARGVGRDPIQLGRRESD
jgi:hypothetical protein